MRDVYVNLNTQNISFSRKEHNFQKTKRDFYQLQEVTTQWINVIFRLLLFHFAFCFELLWNKYILRVHKWSVLKKQVDVNVTVIVKSLLCFFCYNLFLYYRTITMTDSGVNSFFFCFRCRKPDKQIVSKDQDLNIDVKWQLPCSKC